MRVYLRWKKEIDFGKESAKDVVKLTPSELVTKARKKLDNDRSLIEERGTPKFEVVSTKGKVIYTEKF